MRFPRRCGQLTQTSHQELIPIHLEWKRMFSPYVVGMAITPYSTQSHAASFHLPSIRMYSFAFRCLQCRIHTPEAFSCNNQAIQYSVIILSLDQQGLQYILLKVIMRTLARSGTAGRDSRIPPATPKRHDMKSEQPLLQIHAGGRWRCVISDWGAIRARSMHGGVQGEGKGRERGFSEARQLASLLDWRGVFLGAPVDVIVLAGYMLYIDNRRIRCEALSEGFAFVHGDEIRIRPCFFPLLGRIELMKDSREVGLMMCAARFRHFSKSLNLLNFILDPGYVICA